ncbi:MAG: 30S ribosomal protein S10 [Salinisphaeraceae bacterium]
MVRKGRKITVVNLMVTVESMDPVTVDDCARRIRAAADEAGLRVAGPGPYRRRGELTVAQESGASRYVGRIHGRWLRLYQVTEGDLEPLLNLQLPRSSSVNVEVMPDRRQAGA